MSITALAGQPFAATVTNAPASLLGTLTVEVLDASGALVIAPVTTNITEHPQTNGTSDYTWAAPAAPSTPGDYVVRWETHTTTDQTAEESLTVTSGPPAGQLLCTLGDVRALLQKRADDTAQDAVIDMIIPWASQDIAVYCEREFVDSGAGATRTFEAEIGLDGMFVDLAPYDLQTLTAAAIDTDQPTPYTLSTAEWRLWPQPAPDGVYSAVRLAPLGRSLGRVNYRNVQVQLTGTWGFPSVPPAVRKACAVTVAIWMRQQVSAFSTVYKLDEGLVERPEALPSAIARSLNRWRRMAL